MSQLVRLFFLIAISRKGPQDVPHSLFLLVAMIAITAVIEILVLYFFNTREEPLELWVIFKYLLIDNAALILFVYLIFYTHKYKNRFVQSITAIYGTGLIISFFSIPVLILRMFAFYGENVSLAVFGFLMTMFVIGWNLFVNMHIFRFGLSVSPFYAGALSLVLFALSLSIFDLFIPVEATG